jgi:predicted PurR-regulated permease PerM
MPQVKESPEPVRRAPSPTSRTTAIAVTTVAVVAVTGLLYAGRLVLVPVAMAILFSAVLRPAIHKLQAWHVPATAGAGLIVVGGLALLVLAGVAVADPAKEWLARAPAGIAAANRTLQSVRSRFERLIAVTASSSDSQQAPGTAAPSADTSAARSRPAPELTTPQGVPSLGGIVSRAFGTTTEILTETIELLLLLFFVLAAGDRWPGRIAAAMTAADARPRTIRMIDELGATLRRYTLVMLLISTAQGFAVGAAMALAGLPMPMLWGVLTVLAVWIPYVGSAIMIGLLMLVGLASFDSVGRALVAPGVYWGIDMLQANLVSPLLFGQGLKLNPAAILVSLAVWWALWGVAGAFLAVPILAAFRLVCQHVDALGWAVPLLEE